MCTARQEHLVRHQPGQRDLQRLLLGRVPTQVWQQYTLKRDQIKVLTFYSMVSEAVAAFLIFLTVEESERDVKLLFGCSYILVFAMAILKHFGISFIGYR